MIKSQAGRFKRDEEGATMVTTALLLPVLFGFAALAVDGSILFLAKRQIQTIADSGALYGAHEAITIGDYTAADLPTLTTMVEAGATESGYSATSDTLTVATSPVSGAYSGTEPGKFVEVIVTRQVPYIFAGVLGGPGFSTARARAVAGGVVITETTGCLIGLSPDAVGAVTFGGTSAITVPCGVHSNSADARGVIIQGTADVGVTGVASVGGIRENGENANFLWYNPDDPDGQLAINPLANPIPDPSAGFQDTIDAADLTCDITAPSYGVNPNASITYGQAAPGWDVFPAASSGAGYFAGALDNYNPGTVICGDVNFDGQVLLAPGTYYIIGNITFGSQAYVRMDRNGSGAADGGDPINDRDLSPAGVTFVLTNPTPEDSGNLTISASADVQITAPAALSGSPYTGVLFIQNDSAANTANNGSTINGNVNTILDGAMYFPNTAVLVNGGSEQENTCMSIVGYTLEVTGGAAISSDATRCGELGLGSGDGGVTLRRVQLVE